MLVGIIATAVLASSNGVGHVTFDLVEIADHANFAATTGRWLFVALIIAFDSSFPFDVGQRRLTRRAEPFTLWNYDYTRIPSIMEQRASTYQALFFRSLQLEGVFPDDQTMHVVVLRHADAAWQPDLSDLPDVCRTEDPPLDSPTAVVERIAEISTRFWLASPCDRQLLQVAAAKVVAQHHQEISAFLESDITRGAAR